MSLSIPNTFTAGTAISAADVNANFSAIASWANGNITNADIATYASIAPSKLANNLEHMPVNFHPVYGAIYTGRLAFMPLFDDGQGNWTVVGAQWMISDPGSAANKPVVQLEFGYYNAGTWTPTNIGTTFAMTGTDGTPTQGATYNCAGELSMSGSNRILALNVTDIGTAAVDQATTFPPAKTVGDPAGGGGGIIEFFQVSLLLSRTISPA